MLWAVAMLLCAQTIFTLKIWSQAQATERQPSRSLKGSTGLISLLLSPLPLLEGILVQTSPVSEMGGGGAEADGPGKIPA